MIEILCDDSTSCKEECDNNDYHRSRQRQTLNMSVKSMRISWTISFIVLSCTNVKLSFLFLLNIKHYMHSIRKCVQKVIDNICNNSPWT